MFRRIDNRDRHRADGLLDLDPELLLQRGGQRDGRRLGAVRIEARRAYAGGETTEPPRGLVFEHDVEQAREPRLVDDGGVELVREEIDQSRERLSTAQESGR